MRLIDIILRLDLFHADLHPLFPEAHILLLHLLGRLVRDVGGDGVDDEADEARDGEAQEQEDEGEEFGEDGHCCCCCGVGRRGDKSGKP